MSTNRAQEAKDIEKMIPIIKKAHEKQNNIEKGGKFRVVPNLRPRTVIFIKDGENVAEKLENYVNKLNRHTGLYKIRI